MKNFPFHNFRTRNFTSHAQAFGREPNALPRQQLIDNEKVRDSPTLDLQAFRKAEIPSSLRSNDVQELVLKNFAGPSAEQVAERMIELSLYVEEKLKST